jgi:hypothetical protein
MTSISDLIASRKDITIKMGSGRLQVSYDPNMITMAESAKIMRKAEEGDPLAMGERLERVLVDWDLMGPLVADVDVEDGEDDDGEPSFRTERQTVVEEGKKVPLKADVIQYLPNQILLTVLTKVQEDAAPNPTSRKPTPIGSRRRG